MFAPSGGRGAGVAIAPKRLRYISAGKAKTVKAKVTRKGRKAISARRKHRVTVVLTPRGGRPPVSRKLTLRR